MTVGVGVGVSVEAGVRGSVGDGGIGCMGVGVLGGMGDGELASMGLGVLVMLSRTPVPPAFPASPAPHLPCTYSFQAIVFTMANTRIMTTTVATRLFTSFLLSSRAHIRRLVNAASGENVDLHLGTSEECQEKCLYGEG